MSSFPTLQALAESEIKRITAKLPPEIQKALEDLPVHLEARPDAEIATDMSDDLLGLFSGEPIDERGESLDPSPPQIHLYLENLWEESGHDTVRYMQELGITFLHELGHYLGWDEEDMDRHGIA